ncbi:MAG: hypothetical protein GF364_22630 [Candidatus Lokiarchaeota archaeon]|nr:hypothetical protein [Candidatus Lokiarchaeota archaeon]
MESRRPQLLCQECGGSGEHYDYVPGDPCGIPFVCGWCEGTGLVTPYIRGQWLKYKRYYNRL